MINGYTVAGLATLLALSVLGNVGLGRAYLGQRDAAKVATERHGQAVDDAKACSDGTAALREQIVAQRNAMAGRLAEARAQAQRKIRQAEAERNRPQAVPGDVCASAAVETREWLQRRRAGDGR